MNSFPSIRRPATAPTPAPVREPQVVQRPHNTGMNTNAGKKRARTEREDRNETSIKRQRTTQCTSQNPVREAHPTRNNTRPLSQSGSKELSYLISDLTHFISEHNGKIVKPVPMCAAIVSNITTRFRKAVESNRHADDAHRITPHQLVALAYCVEKLSGSEKLTEKSSVELFSPFFSCLNHFFCNENSPTLRTKEITHLMPFFHNKEPSAGSIALLETLVEKLNYSRGRLDAQSVSTVLGAMPHFSKEDIAYDLLDALWCKVDMIKDNPPMTVINFQMGIFGLENFISAKSDSVDLLREYLISSLQCPEEIPPQKWKYCIDYLKNASSPVIQAAFEKMAPIFCSQQENQLGDDGLINLFKSLSHCKPVRSIERLLDHLTPQITPMLNANILNWKIIKIIGGLEKLGPLKSAQDILASSHQYLVNMTWKEGHQLDDLVKGFSSFPTSSATDNALFSLARMIVKNSFKREEVQKALVIMKSRPDSNGKVVVINKLNAKLK